MRTLKFDESDRRKVIAEVEAHFATKLSQVGRFKKYLEDEQGRPYWVLGGYDDWHGVSAEMVKKERRRQLGGVLVVAKRGRTSIDIYAGDLQQMVARESDLSHTQTGDYQFNIHIRGNSMMVKEISGLVLHKLGPTHEVGLPIVAMISKMSDVERQRLFKAMKDPEGV